MKRLFVVYGSRLGAVAGDRKSGPSEMLMGAKPQAYAR
jgi:hypothetical protein